MAEPTPKENSPEFTNRLIHEKSPYLLQHAHNPVDWYSWGEEAFEKARRENKPILLSIGYSTCHWCHVMERESYSVPEIARVISEHFVAIKLDREERPDIDAVYMKAAMVMNGSGGWPLNVWLTPDRKPFYAGTYFPPEDRWGMPSFKNVLLAIARLWETKREEALRSAERLTEAIKNSSRISPRLAPLPALREGEKEGVTLDESILESGARALRSQYDSRFGGFGEAPKFPRSHTLSFLARQWKRKTDPAILESVEKTLEEMAKGGMYDQLGGGFHRYSTDSEWRVPHFEKMLYDQALLSMSYLEAYQITGKEFYAGIARAIFDYVLRDLNSPQGAFTSAEDADSALDPSQPDEKREGAFYLWEEAEIGRLLEGEDRELFKEHFGVLPKGNILEDPHGEFGSRNVLYVNRAADEMARLLKKSPAESEGTGWSNSLSPHSTEEIEAILKKAEERLFNVRAMRPRPHLDDKVLTDWNGLMIASLAFGSRVLGELRYRESARRAADFLLSRMRRSDGRLLHRYRDGEAGIPATLEDYAFLIHGLLHLYEAVLEPEYLAQAKRLTEEMIRLFWDSEGGGFFMTAHDAEPLLIREKEVYDGAIPSGNSVAALDLLRIGRMTMEKDFEKKALEIMSAFSNELRQAPTAYPQMLIALDFALGPMREIVIAGREGEPASERLIDLAFQTFDPRRVLLFHPEEGEAKTAIEALAPFIKEQGSRGGRATAYLCQNYSCQFPTTDLEEFRKLLSG